MGKDSVKKASPYPGCMGGFMHRLAGRKLLTDHGHRGGDGSGNSKQKPDFSDDYNMDDFRSREDNKVRYETSKARNSKKSVGTAPTEGRLESKRDRYEGAPNLVARLMGLDMLPSEAPIHSRVAPHNHHHQQQQQQYEHQHQNQHQHQHLHQQPPNQHQYQQQELIREKLNQVRLARERFAVAASKNHYKPPPDPCDPKEFEDAVEFLQSNKELFLKFVHNPGSSTTGLIKAQGGGRERETRTIDDDGSEKPLDSYLSFSKKAKIPKPAHEEIRRKDQFFMPKMQSIEQVLLPDKRGHLRNSFVGNNTSLHQIPTRIVVLKPKARNGSFSVSSNNGYPPSPTLTSGTREEQQLQQRGAWLDGLRKEGQGIEDRGEIAREIARHVRKCVARDLANGSNCTLQGIPHLRASSYGQKALEVEARLDSSLEWETSSECKNGDESENGSPRALLRSRSLPRERNHRELLPRNSVADRSNSIQMTAGRMDASRVLDETPARSIFGKKINGLKGKFSSKKLKNSELESRSIDRGLNNSDHSSSSSERLPSCLHLVGEKVEQPSPVSVLDCPFSEDATTPVNFKEIRSDLQELRLRLHFLKCNNAKLPQQAAEINQEDCSLIQNDEASREVDRNTVHPRSLQYDFDNLETKEFEEATATAKYVKRVLQVSGFTRERDTRFIRWHAANQPLDPYLFVRMEECYYNIRKQASSVVGNNRTNKAGENREILDTPRRHLLFDCVNKALLDLSGLYRSYKPWVKPLTRSSFISMPTGEKWVDHVVMEIQHMSYSHSDSHESLENLIANDLAKEGCARAWIGLTDDVESVGLHLEKMVFDELLEDLVYGFCR